MLGVVLLDAVLCVDLYYMFFYATLNINNKEKSKKVSKY